MKRAPLKICGLTTPGDALECAAAGVAALGVVFYPPSPRNVTPERAAEVFAPLPSGVARVGVFVDVGAEFILRAAGTAGLDAAQLHGSESPDLAAELLSNGLGVVKVLRGGDLAAEAARFPAGTRFLVECGRGALPGGNGSAWDWKAARALDPRAFAIAGGLSPANIAAAAAESCAVFFDLSSAVETVPGRKAPSLVRAAAEAALAAGGDPDFIPRRQRGRSANHRLS